MSSQDSLDAQQSTNAVQSTDAARNTHERVPAQDSHNHLKPPRASLILLASVTLTTLALDLWTKDWALRTLETHYSPNIPISKPIYIYSWLSMVLARNRGGAWGILQNSDEALRKPFFLIVTVFAIILILYLYRRVHPKQHALKWGLPMVLGGAIGNLVDRVRHGWVVDFIDYKAAWVRVLNEQLARVFDNHAVTDHWPTFNVADIAIVAGLILMAIDVFTSRKLREEQAQNAQNSAHKNNTLNTMPLLQTSSNHNIDSPSSETDASKSLNAQTDQPSEQPKCPTTNAHDFDKSDNADNTDTLDSKNFDLDESRKQLEPVK